MSAMLSRLVLRVAALGLKFALTIVVARSLGFDAVGAYGVAMAASVVASKILGLGFSTELNRRLAAGAPADAIRAAKRLFVLYGAVYAVLCLPLAVPGWVAGLLRFAALPDTPLWLIALIACAEHAALEINTYLYSLHRPRAATWLLFLRTGAWAGVAIAALVLRLIQSIEALFAIWLVADVAVVVIGWALVGRVARQLHGAQVEPAATRSLSGVWVNGLPFFAALLLLSALQYLERFVAADVLTANELGRYVFAWSIANAVQTVAAATVVFTAAPRLVRAAAQGPAAFRHTLLRTVGASLLLCGAAAVGIMAMRGPIFALAHESDSGQQTSELLLLLLSFVLRACADVLWAAAVALKAGRPVAMAMAVLTVACLPWSMALIHGFGAAGAAYAHLSASITVAAAICWIVAARLTSLARATQETGNAA